MGDLCHYTAIITIFVKIIASKSCMGISGRSQILFLLVFLTRYMDVFTHFISMYNTSIKIFFIISTTTNIYLVFVKYAGTISSDMDTFRIEFLILGAALLALFVNHDFSFQEVLWTFSVYLESVAIIPQLNLSSKAKQLENVMLGYLCTHALYKFFYILNWVHRYYNEGGNYDGILFASGLLQTVIYSNFFVLYLIKRLADGKSETGV